MRQGNAVGVASGKADAKAPSDQLMERSGLKVAVDREPADGNHEVRAEKLELALEPRRARADLLGRGNPVAALG